MPNFQKLFMPFVLCKFVISLNSLNTLKRTCLIFVCFLFSLFLDAQNLWLNKDCRAIYEWQDKRNSKELLRYFKHKNEKYRRLAVLAFGSVQDTLAVPDLLKVLKNDQDFTVRAAAAYSLGQMRKPWLCSDLLKAYKANDDKLVRYELLEAIVKCATKEAIPFFEHVDLSNSYMHVEELYSKFAKGIFFSARRGFKSDSMIERLNSIKSSSPITAYVYHNLTKNKPKGANDTLLLKPVVTDKQCLDSLSRLADAYYKVKVLETWQVNPKVYYILAFSNEPHFLRSYCMEQYLKGKLKDTNVIHQCLTSNNLAFISMAAEKIRKDSINWDSARNVQYLLSAKKSLTMPRDFEAYVEIEKTLCYLQKKIYQYAPPTYNHPINWQYIEKLKPEEKVKITTDKGTMVMTCYVNEAPASVANFLLLVDSCYYSKKYIHRMVPDFVVQGGCPRGDGWGALNWTQRSEFSPNLNYKKGSIGLASAGKDSEGVQIFITHGFTPSLDGRYTIFAEITEGLEIIDQLNIGDQIISIERIL